MNDDEIIAIAVKTSLLNYIDNETPRRFFISGHAELDDVVAFGRAIAATAFEKASNVMRADVDYWRNDSASAWDKCEERRIENERLRAALGVFACECLIGERCAVPDNCRNFQARRTLEKPHDR